MCDLYMVVGKCGCNIKQLSLGSIIIVEQRLGAHLTKCPHCNTYYGSINLVIVSTLSGSIVDYTIPESWIIRQPPVLADETWKEVSLDMS